jgi:type II secretory pathway pseudopilin PulG
MKKRRRNFEIVPRCGTSLVEMLVVMTVAAAMVGLAVTTIHRLLGAEHEATKQARYAASLARLSQAFRDDLHAAQKVELPAVEPGEPAALVTTLPDGRRIRYELDAHRATRVEIDGSDETHRDAFYFPPRSRLEFDRSGDRGLVRLTIEMPAGVAFAKPKDSAAASQPMQLLLIEAAPFRAHDPRADAGSGQRANDGQLNSQKTHNTDKEKNI